MRIPEFPPLSLHLPLSLTHHPSFLLPPLTHPTCPSPPTALHARPWRTATPLRTAMPTTRRGRLADPFICNQRNGLRILFVCCIAKLILKLILGRVIKKKCPASLFLVQKT